MKTSDTIRIFLSLFSKNRRLNIYLVSLFGLAIFFIEASFVVILQGFIYSLDFINIEQTILPNWYPRNFIYSLILIALFGIFRFLIYVSKDYLSLRLSQSFVTEKRSQIIDGATYYANRFNFSDLSTFFNEDVYKVSGSIVYFVNLMIAIVASTFYFVFGFKLAPLEMALGFILLTLVAIPIKFLSQKITKESNSLSREAQEYFKKLSDGFNNYFYLAINNKLLFHSTETKKNLKKYEKHFLTFAKVSSINSYLPQFVGICVIVIVSWISKSYTATTSINLISFLYIFIRFAAQAASIVQSYNNFKLTSVNIVRIQNLNAKLSNFSKMDQRDIGQTDTLEKVDIQFDKVDFKYDKKNIISSLTLSLKNGESLLIKGESGSGKSTILSLLTGILIPSCGDILINGNSSSSEKSKLRNSLSYVGPNSYLVSGTIRDNLLVGNVETNDDHIWRLLDAVNLSDVIKSFPLGLDDILSDHTELSTGQQQRLSMVRALLKKPKLLILDEATSNLDNETEREIIKFLDEYCKDVTKVIVTHKDTFDMYIEKKILLEKEINKWN